MRVPAQFGYVDAPPGSKFKPGWYVWPCDISFAMAHICRVYIGPFPSDSAAELVAEQAGWMKGTYG